ncbi:RNA polymerase sigma-70 factor [Parapedobacter sp. 10938]|uniref:RNA polymerase sigma-70 factor n=1 Tax=Parapedobacter flavus TaxID=3110225 RepID=UPI002DB917D4|nr:RNA polymerase sigma-70 factor [Parapedobacter sp. 10938]MEC3880584.1 RNA polymerase sigma-70 factor [Parapedobacter sp. 10938]
MADCESLSRVEDFERCYKAYYSMLCMIAYEYTRDQIQAEEMVSHTFLALWEKRESLQITTSVKNYLIKSTQNTCLQYLRKRKLETQSLTDDFVAAHIPWSSDYPLGQLFEKELSNIVDKAIEALPPQCRKVFLLSRVEELSYIQIAKALQVSENTVKTQMKTALSRLRHALKEYLPIMAVFTTFPFFF